MKKITYILYFWFVYFHAYSQQAKLIQANKIWLQNDTLSTTYLLNHHNYLLNKQLQQKQLQGILKKKHTLFIVYTYDTNTSASSILELVSNKSKIEIGTNLSLKQKEQRQTKKGYVSDILSIRTINRKLKGGDLQISTEFIQNNRIYELIYFSEWLNKKNKQQIETYLAIKYGISLYKELNYYDTDYNIIWDAKKNKGYSNRVFGTGYDTGSGLQQYTSTHSVSNLLQISFSEPERIIDKSYFIIGDNGRNLNYKLNDNQSVKILDRKWKISQTGNNQIDINLNTQEANDTNADYWLMLCGENFNPSNSIYIKGKMIKPGKYYFDHVKFYKYNFFTFVKTQKDIYPGFEIQVYPNPVIKGGNLQVQIKVPDKQEVYVSIYNEAGQIIFSEKKVITDNQTINYVMPKTGIYFLKISTVKFIKTTKILVE